jgi:hypothetical protein
MHDKVLRAHLVSRQVPLGLRAIDDAKKFVQLRASTDFESIKLIAEMVNWIDFRFSLRDELAKELARWPPPLRRQLGFDCVVLLWYIEAVLEIHREKFSSARRLFERVIEQREALDDHQLHFLAKHYKARCDFYIEDYKAVEDFCQEDAPVLVKTLERSDLQLAVVAILHSRVIIKTKPAVELQRARDLLKSAYNVFAKTEDNVTRGNIRTFLALASKRGPHERAAGLLPAIREFRQPRSGERGPLPGEARAMRHRIQQLLDEIRTANIECSQRRLIVKRNGGDRLMEAAIKLGPQLKRAIALAGMKPVLQKLEPLLSEMQDHIDDQPAIVRSSPEHRIVRRRRLALGYLRRIERIYAQLNHPRGIAHSKIDAAYIHLESGEAELALAYGADAYDIGAGNETAEARAAIVCAAAAYSCYEEQGDTGVDYGRKAQLWANRAMKHAPRTEPRILGRAIAWTGITCFVDGRPDRAKAEECSAQVLAKLREYPGGSLHREFEMLQKLLKSAGTGPSADAIAWFRDPLGSIMSFERIEQQITRRAWEVTNSLRDFMTILSVERKKAVGLLDRAGIDFAKSKIPRCTSIGGRVVRKQAS